MEFTLEFIKLFFRSIYLAMPLFVLLGIVIIAMGQLACRMEKWTWFDGLYWTLITATTVGYGDIRPLRKLSKVLSIFIALIGVMFTGLLIAITVKTALNAFEIHGGSPLKVENKASTKPLK